MSLKKAQETEAIKHCLENRLSRKQYTIVIHPVNSQGNTNFDKEIRMYSLFFNSLKEANQTAQSLCGPNESFSLRH